MEVPVIARHRADELDLVVFTPGLIRFGESDEHRVHQNVIHQIQRGVAAGKDLVIFHAHDFGKNGFQFRDSGGETIVPNVESVPVFAIFRRFQIGHHAERKIQLSGFRFSS